MKYTPDHINRLKPGQIFVFGSNEVGRHAGGAAFQAVVNFGAQSGRGFGLHGQTFALPTMGYHGVSTLEDIQMYVHALKGVILSRPDLEFLITRVGCGIAGYTPQEIAPLFSSFLHIPNAVLPEDFVEIIIHGLNTN